MAVKRIKRQSARRRAAATADVIGTKTPPKERIPNKWKGYYKHLIQTRDYLLNRQNDLVKDAAEEQPSFSLHMADAGTDSFDRDFALSRASSEQDALYEIEEALMRIRRGTYGVCELTGKPIEAKRLEAVPWARFSTAAEKQLEREGGGRRARLAPRGEFAREGISENETDLSNDDQQSQQD